MSYKDRIEIDYRKMLGKPCIRGTRITVEKILQKLSEGMQFNQIIEAYPNITVDDIYAAIAFSADLLKMEEPLAS